jgi:hypothetical protein
MRSSFALRLQEISPPLNSAFLASLQKNVAPLLAALNVIRQSGPDRYIVYSNKSERKLFYEVNEKGNIALRHQEEVAMPSRSTPQ